MSKFSIRNECMTYFENDNKHFLKSNNDMGCDMFLKIKIK